MCGGGSPPATKSPDLPSRWGPAGSVVGRDGSISGEGSADYKGAFTCEPWPECFKGNFLEKLGLVGKEARKGRKKR